MRNLSPLELTERKADTMQRILTLTEDISAALAGQNPVEIMGLLLRRQTLMTQVDEIDKLLKAKALPGQELGELPHEIAELARRAHELDGANLLGAREAQEELRGKIHNVERGRRSAQAYETGAAGAAGPFLDQRK